MSNSQPTKPCGFNLRANAIYSEKSLIEGTGIPIDTWEEFRIDGMKHFLNGRDAYYLGKWIIAYLEKIGGQN